MYKKLARNKLNAAAGLAIKGLMASDFIKNSNNPKLAKYPTIATEKNRKNCLNGANLDSEKTTYLVIRKFTNTPKKNEIVKEIA